MTIVPVIDLSDPRGPAAIAAEIGKTCRETGFFLVTGHGADAGVIDEGWRMARAFFDLPLDAKMETAPPYAGYPYGYLAVKTETLAASLGDARPADLKESFAFGPSEFQTLDRPARDDAEAFVFSPNRWPAEPADFRPAMRAYYAELSALAGRIMRFFALALDLREDYFERFIDHEASALRLLNYPDVDQDPLPGQLRAGAHSDYGSLTILLQEDAPGGLEVLGLDGAWHRVPAIPGSFVINIGDLMQRWTNDLWKSTLHRVVVPPRNIGRSARRQSMAFFHQPNWDAEIACIPTCLKPGESPRHPPVGSGEYLASKFRSTVVKA